MQAKTKESAASVYFQGLSPRQRSISFVTLVFLYLTMTLFAKAVWGAPNLELHLTLAIVLLSPFCFKKWIPTSFAGLRLPQSNLGAVLTASYVILCVLSFSLLNKQNQFKVWPFAKDYFYSNFNTLFTLCVVVPIAEESFFRSFLFGVQNDLAKKDANHRGFWRGIQFCYFNSFVFWLFHLPGDMNLLVQSLAQHSLPVPLGPFFLGLVCSAIVWVDRSIFFAILLHALSNLSAPFWSDALTRFGVFELFYF